VGHRYRPTQKCGVRPDRLQGAHAHETKDTICLWFDKDAHEAARFYAVTFPDSRVTAVREAPGDYPGGKKGNVLTVEFTRNPAAANSSPRSRFQFANLGISDGRIRTNNRDLVFHP
jgi:hypothetical protein